MRTSSIYLSMENDVLPLNPEPNLIEVSPEEAAILVGEVGDDHILINDMVEQSSQAQAIAAGLEDILVIADEGKLDGGDVVTAGLVGAVGEMATAGTDIDASDVIPGVAMEDLKSIKNKIAEIWKTILAHLNEMWGRLKSMFDKFDTILAHYEKTFKGYLENPRPNNEATLLRGWAGSRKVAKKEVDGTYIGQGWTDINTFIKEFLIHGTRDNLRMANHSMDYAASVKRAIETKPGMVSYSAITNKLVNAISSTQREMNGSIAKSKIILPGRYAVTTNADEHLPKQNLVYSYTKSEEGKPLEIMNTLLGIKFEFGPVLSENSADKDVSVSKFPADHLAQMLKPALEAIKAAQSYVYQGVTQLEGGIERLKKTTDDLTKMSLEKAPDAEAYVQLATKLNTYISNSVVPFNISILRYLKDKLSEFDAFVQRLPEKVAEKA